MIRIFVLLLALACSLPVAAAGVMRLDVEAPMSQVYRLLYQELESRRLWVVFEPDLGQTISGMADRLGDDYNRNGLEGIRSLVTCNAWYANQVSNLDPQMLALCPLRVSVVHKEGSTRLLFARPSLHAQGSAALPVLQEIEGLVLEAMQAAVAAANDQLERQGDE